MLKSVAKLIRDARMGKVKATYGNHSMNVVGHKVRFFYHNTCVCEVDRLNNTVEYDDGGWSGYSSTTRTINSYKAEFGA